MASGPPFPPPYNPSPSSYPPNPSAPNPEGEYRWLAPASFSGPEGPGDWPGQTGRPALYELRPLSTGEVLDRTFSLFRSHFLLFAGIASLAGVVRLVGTGAQLGVQATILRTGTFTGIGVTNNLLSLGASIIFLLAFAVTQAATMWAVGEVYLGRSAAIGTSLRTVLPRWLRYVGIAFWQSWSALWPTCAVLAVFGTIWLLDGRSFGSLGMFGAYGLIVFLVLGALAVGVFFYLRNLLAVPAAVSEGLGVRAAMRRSKSLSRGAKGKLFLVLLIAFALYMVMSVVLAITLGVTMIFHHGTTPASLASGSGLIIIGAVTLVIVFVGYTVISPVVMIGVSLIYFDQRVRKEAFDVAVLLEEESAVAAEAGIPVPEVAQDAAMDIRSAHAAGSAAAEVWAAEQPVSESSVSEPFIEPPGGASGI